MTREEAKQILEVNKPVIKWKSASTMRYIEAFDMAMSALKKLEEIENIIGYANLYMNDTEKYNKIKKVVERDD